MEQTNVAPVKAAAPGVMAHLDASIIAAIVVGFLLRGAGGASGILLGFYLNRVVHPPAIDPGVIAGLTAAFFISEFLLAPVFGSWSDQIGRKPFLLAGPIIAGLAVQLHPLTTFLFVIFAGRLLEGIATSATTPGTLGYLSDVTSGNTQMRGRVMGLFELGSLLGIVLGPALGGQLWDLVQQNGLRLISLLDIVAALLVFFWIRESRPGHGVVDPAAPTSPTWRQRVTSYRALLRLPALWRFAPAWIAVNAVVGLWFSHISPILSRGQHDSSQLLMGGWSGGQVRNAFLGFGLAFMIGIFFWSQMYGRLRRTNIMLLAIGGTFVVCAVLLAINMQLLPGPWGQWPLLPLLFAGLFVESGFTPVALAYLADVTESQVTERGAVMGLYSVFLGLGQLLGAIIAVPFIQAFGFNGVILCTALLTAIAGGAVLSLRAATGD